MSKEYIDRKELLELYQDDKLDLTKTCVPVEVVIQNIKDMPAADVAEVVHGKWEFEPNLFDENTYRCSVCGEVWTLISGTLKENNMNFCMRCGAKMDGGKANE